MKLTLLGIVIVIERAPKHRTNYASMHGLVAAMIPGAMHAIPNHDHKGGELIVRRIA